MGKCYKLSVGKQMTSSENDPPSLSPREKVWPSRLYDSKQNGNVQLENNIGKGSTTTFSILASPDTLMAPRWLPALFHAVLCRLTSTDHHQPGHHHCNLLQEEKVLELFPSPYKPCFAFFSSGHQVCQTAVKARV